MDVDRAGRPRRRRRGGAVHHRGGDHARAASACGRACCRRPSSPPTSSLAGTLDAIAALEQHLGPFPYETLTVALLPDYGGGIEYPSLILQATPSPQVLVHEVAHMWFYGMVGNSQFRDPWLDEAFASWAEALVDGHAGLVDEDALALDGPGRRRDGRLPGPRATYFRVVYDKGGAALLAAREAAGAEAFDAAIRCYVDASAWSIATPDDLGRALADLPEALAVLNTAGRPGQGRRAALRPGAANRPANYSAEPSSRCMRLTPSTRSSSPRA